MRVQITLEDDDYHTLKLLADEEDRGVAQQARHMLRWALRNSQGEASTWVPVTTIRRDDTSNAALHDPQSPELVSSGLGGLNSTVCPSCAHRAGTPHSNTCPLAGGIPVDNSND